MSARHDIPAIVAPLGDIVVREISIDEIDATANTQVRRIRSNKAGLVALLCDELLKRAANAVDGISAEDLRANLDPGGLAGLRPDCLRATEGPWVCHTEYSGYSGWPRA